MAQNSTDQRGSSRLGADFFQNVQIAFQLFMDRRVSTATKLLVPALALGYFLLPIDLLPDVVPFLGQIDDIAVLLLLLRLFVTLAPQDVVAEYRAAKGQGASRGNGAETSAGPGQGSNKTGSQANPAAGQVVVDAEYRVVNDA